MVRNGVVAFVAVLSSKVSLSGIHTKGRLVQFLHWNTGVSENGRTRSVVLAKLVGIRAGESGWIVGDGVN